MKIEEILKLHPEWLNSFDLIYDCAGTDSYYTLLAPKLLKPDAGRFVTAVLPASAPGKAGEDVGFIDGIKLAAKIFWRWLTGNYFLITGLFGGLPTKDGFKEIVKWMEEGKLVVKVWKTYTLTQMREAHQASETGRTIGKIAVIVS